VSSAADDIGTGDGTVNIETSTGGITIGSLNDQNVSVGSAGSDITITADDFDLNADNNVTIDTTDTTDGIKIGTSTSGVPITLGHSTSEVTVADNLNVTGDLTVSGTTVTMNTSAVEAVDKNLTLGAVTPTQFASITGVTISSTGSDTQLSNLPAEFFDDVVVGSRLSDTSSAVGATLATVTAIDENARTATVNQDDWGPGQGSNQTIYYGDTAATDSTADGGGITVKGSTNKTFNWANSTDSWTSSENIDLASGKTFKINGTTVLSATTLGSSVTSVGTISTGVWNATDIAIAHGGTGASSATAARANLGLEIGTDVQGYNSNLNAISGLNTDDGGVIVGTGSTFALETGSTLRTSLGLAIGSDVQAYDAQLDTLAGYTSTQIGFLNVSTAGAVEASKVVVVDSSKNIGTFGTVTAATFTANTSLTAPQINVDSVAYIDTSSATDQSMLTTGTTIATFAYGTYRTVKFAGHVVNDSTHQTDAFEVLVTYEGASAPSDISDTAMTTYAYLHTGTSPMGTLSVALSGGTNIDLVYSADTQFTGSYAVTATQLIKT
jgi:hypothetical protein